jgi:hypothetical protein
MNSWAWIKGSKDINQLGVYGTMGIADISNQPGARWFSSSATDDSGYLWLFGGLGYSAAANGYLNDLWKYNPSTNQWAWVKGDDAVRVYGVYGIQGVPAVNNKPGARMHSTMWTDAQNHLWLFGGERSAANLLSGSVDDLWKYSSLQPLPVHLLSFTTRLQRDEVDLNWKVENEISLDRYEVEQSNNGSNFDKIGTVKAVNAKEYSFVDDTWKMTTDRHQYLYYKLKMIDKDGKFTYSKIVSVTIPNTNSFTIYPNPAKTEVQLQFNKSVSGNVTIQVADYSGKITISKTANLSTSNYTLSIANLPVGAYSVKVIKGDNQYIETLVIVK